MLCDDLWLYCILPYLPLVDLYWIRPTAQILEQHYQQRIQKASNDDILELALEVDSPKMFISTKPEYDHTMTDRILDLEAIHIVRYVYWNILPTLHEKILSWRDLSKKHFAVLIQVPEFEEWIKDEYYDDAVADLLVKNNVVLTYFAQMRRDVREDLMEHFQRQYGDQPINERLRRFNLRYPACV